MYQFLTREKSNYKLFITLDVALITFIIKLVYKIFAVNLVATIVGLVFSKSKSCIYYVIKATLTFYKVFCRNQKKKKKKKFYKVL